MTLLGFPRIGLAILTGLFLSAAAIHPARALENPAPLQPNQRPAAPPFSIKGWKYVLGPNNIHFYLCEVPACGPQSKVSWMPLRQTFSSLDEYKAGRRFLLDVLRKRLPAGAEITTDEAQEKTVADIRVMSSVRHEIAADRSVLHTVSQAVLGKTAAIDLISSSTNLASAKANAELFLVPVLILIKANEKPKQASPQ